MAENELVDEFYVADKESGYVYKWSNSREREMMKKLRKGYEVVETPEAIPDVVRALNPSMQGPATTVRQRGDLVLMRIRQDLWEKNVAGPIRLQRQRQKGALGDAVQRATETQARQLREKNMKVPATPMVFETDPEAFKR